MIIYKPIYVLIHTFVSATLILPEYLDSRFVVVVVAGWLNKGNKSLPWRNLSFLEP